MYTKDEVIDNKGTKERKDQNKEQKHKEGRKKARRRQKFSNKTTSSLGFY